jgi:preprotein translocase subunit SecF
MKTHIILAAMAIIGFVINETIVVIAQSNSTNADRRNVILTWLDTNITKTVSAPMISISNEDFWKNFEPLLEQSINGSTDSSE